MRFRNSDRNPRWRTLLIVLATALVVAPAAAFASNSFTDVADSDFFHDAVDWMADNGVTVGCNPPDNTRYCPDQAVTRGEMAVFLERLDTKNVFVRPGEDAVDGGNADTVDGMHSSEFLGANEKAVDSDKLDGKDSTAFLSSSLDGFVPIARFKLDGSVVDSEWRAPLTGPPTATFGSGRYVVDLPGISWGFADPDDQVVCTAMNGDYYAATDSISGNDLLVYLRDSSGTASNEPATCVVYDAD